MGGRNSRPPSPPWQDIQEMIQIDILKSRLANIQTVNSMLRNNIQNLNYTQTYYIKVPNETKLAEWGSKNATLADITIPNDQEILKKRDDTITSNEIDISKLHSNINDFKKSILTNELYDINTRQNIFDSINYENNAIKNQILLLSEKSTVTNEKFNYSLQQLNEVKNIDVILFIIYYSLFIILCFFIFRNKLSKYVKAGILFIFLTYPFFIYFLETLVYLLFYNIYLNIFPVFTIEKI